MVLALFLWDRLLERDAPDDIVCLLVPPFADTEGHAGHPLYQQQGGSVMAAGNIKVYLASDAEGAFPSAFMQRAVCRKDLVTVLRQIAAAVVLEPRLEILKLPNHASFNLVALSCKSLAELDTSATDKAAQDGMTTLSKDMVCKGDPEAVIQGNLSTYLMLTQDPSLYVREHPLGSENQVDLALHWGPGTSFFV